MRYDLHTHSIFSDGTWTPQQLVAAAAEQDLTVALTDHNTVSGLPIFLETAQKLGVEAVPGIEFSTDYLEKDVHIVALFVREESYDAIRAYAAKGDRAKERSNRDMVRRLQAAGYELNYDEIVAQTPDGRINRANIAGELVRLGYVASVQEAFSRLLHPKHGFFTPPKRPGSWDTVAFIRSIGALPVLAHPLLTMDEEMLRGFLPEAKARGLAAMETAYSSYDAQTAALARQIAGEFGLLPSGGSDFHGDRKPDIQLGCPAISRQDFENLRAAL